MVLELPKIGNAIELRFSRHLHEVTLYSAEKFGTTFLPRQYVPESSNFSPFEFYYSVNNVDGKPVAQFVVPDPMGILGEAMDVNESKVGFSRVDLSRRDALFSILIPDDLLATWSITMYSDKYCSAFKFDHGRAVVGSPFEIQNVMSEIK